jgi:DNA polymerase IIIc chi subunit
MLINFTNNVDSKNNIKRNGRAKFLTFNMWKCCVHMFLAHSFDSEVPDPHFSLLIQKTQHSSPHPKPLLIAIT